MDTELQCAFIITRIMMQITKFLCFIEQYIFQFVFTCIHELSHYVFALYFWAIGAITFPKWNWTRKASIIIQNDRSITSFGHSMDISYNSPRNLRFMRYIIIPCSPAVFTIILFIISPWYLWIFYLSHISILWMSIYDMDKVKFYFDLHIRAKRIRDTKIILKELSYCNPLYND